MDENRIWGVSIQQIQIFLKAMELRNFTRVAAHFNFTPSMVSKTISVLEAEVGIKLFDRSPGVLVPTAAGLYLAGEWRQCVSSICGAIERTRAFEQDGSLRISLGFVDSSNWVDDVVSKLLQAYAQIKPNVVVSAEKHDMHRAVELLNAGMLDIALTSEIEVPYLDDHGLPWEKLFDTSVVVYVPRGNELFEREGAVLTFDDLARQELIGLAPQMHPAYQDWLVELCGRYGFTPKVVATYRTVRSLMFNLRLGSHVFVGDSVTSDWCDEGLKMFELPERSSAVLAWRAPGDKELADFRAYFKQSWSR